MACVAALLSACSGDPPGPKQSLGMMTALPLFWEEGNADDLIGKRDQRASVIRMLAKDYDVRPLDILDADALAGLKLLILAQPRVLAPAELVAVDLWVRGGGRVLIFADPALDWPSRYPPGDPRRAPPVTLLDPLFAHWGLALAMGEATAGKWAAKGEACRIEDDGLNAVCLVGSGKAILVADADMLDLDSPESQNQENDAVISALVSRLAREIPKPRYEQEKNKEE